MFRIDSLRSESRPSKSAKVVNPKVVSNLTGSSKEKSVTMYTNGSEKGSTLKATVPEKVPAKGISLESARKTQQKGSRTILLILFVIEVYFKTQS